MAADVEVLKSFFLLLAGEVSLMLLRDDSISLSKVLSDCDAGGADLLWSTEEDIAVLGVACGSWLLLLVRFTAAAWEVCLGTGSLTVEVTSFCEAPAAVVGFGAVTSCSCRVTFGDDRGEVDFSETRSSKDSEEEVEGLATLMFINFRF